MLRRGLDKCTNIWRWFFGSLGVGDRVVMIGDECVHDTMENLRRRFNIINIV